MEAIQPTLMIQTQTSNSKLDLESNIVGESLTEQLRKCNASILTIDTNL